MSIRMPVIQRFVIALVLLGTPAVQASNLPRLAVTDLNNNAVVLPKRDQASVYIVTFSRQAGALAEPWEEALRDTPGLYWVSVLEGIPRFVRRIIRAAMRKQFPQAGFASFVTTDKDREAWRVFSNSRNPDLPAIVCVDPAPVKVFAIEGPFTVTLLQALPCKPKQL